MGRVRVRGDGIGVVVINRGCRVVPRVRVRVRVRGKVKVWVRL